MKYLIRKSKSSLKKEVLIITYIIYMSGNTILFGTNGNSLFTTLSMLCECALGAFFFIYVTLNCKKRISNRVVETFILIYANIILTWLLNGDFLSFAYIYYILLIGGSFLISNYIEFEDFKKIYCDIIYFFCCVSLVCSLIYVICPSIIQKFPITYNSHKLGYYNLGFWVTSTDFEYEFRNYGCFREPGVFQIYIILALIFLFKEKLNIKHFFVYTITLLTTKSTTGYILFAILMIRYFFNENTGLIKKILMFVAFICAIIAVVIHEINASGYSIFGKFAITNISFMTRFANIFVDYEIFKQNPILGVGITLQNDLQKILPMKMFGINTGGVDTNTYFSLLATFGICYFIISLILTYKFASKNGDKIIEKALIFLILILALITENFRYSLFFYVILWYGIISTKYYK